MLEDAKQAKSMTGIGLEPQLVEHLSTIGAFLERKDETVDVAQLNEQLAKMISDLQSVKALLTHDSGSVINDLCLNDSSNHNTETLKLRPEMTSQV